MKAGRSEGPKNEGNRAKRGPATQAGEGNRNSGTLATAVTIPDWLERRRSGGTAANGASEAPRKPVERGSLERKRCARNWWKTIRPCGPKSIRPPRSTAVCEKTARTVVWEGAGAQSPALHPIPSACPEIA